MKTETKSLAAKDVFFLFWYKDDCQAEDLWNGRPRVTTGALTQHNVASEWIKYAKQKKQNKTKTNKKQNKKTN